MACSSHWVNCSRNLVVSKNSSPHVRVNAINLKRPQQNRLERFEVIARSISAPQVSRDSTLFSDASSVFSDTEFDFDHELINTAVYRRVLHSHFRGSGSPALERTTPSGMPSGTGKNTIKDCDDVEDLIRVSPELSASKKNPSAPRSRSNDYEREETIEPVVGLESLRIMEEKNESLGDDGGLSSSKLEGKLHVLNSPKPAQVAAAFDDSQIEAVQTPEFIVGVNFGTSCKFPLVTLCKMGTINIFPFLFRDLCSVCGIL